MDTIQYYSLFVPLFIIEFMTALALVKVFFYHQFKIKQIMSTQAEFQQVLVRIDGATNQVAAKVRTLEDKIKNAGLSAEQESEFLSTISGMADQLEAIGKTETPIEDGGE